MALQEDIARTVGRKGLVHCSFYQLDQGHLFFFSPPLSFERATLPSHGAGTAPRGLTALTTRGVYDIGTQDLVLKALAGTTGPSLLPAMGQLHTNNRHDD